MSDKSRSRIRGCAIGCAALIAIPFVGVFAIGVRTCVPLRSAQNIEARLEERFGAPDSFTPRADDTIPEDRIRAFLQVRLALTESCARFENLIGHMDRLAALEPDADGSEVAGTARGFAETAVGIAPEIGDFFEVRNRALLEAGMGLGEHAYLFAVAYRDRLLDPRHHDSLFAEGRSVGPEVAALLRKIVENQRRAVAESGDGERPSALAREIAAMERDPERLPWSDGLPEALAASLDPFRDELEVAFCPATAGIDSDLSSRRALVIALE